MNIIRTEKDGIEFFTVAATGESGSSQSGLAVLSIPVVFIDGFIDMGYAAVVWWIAMSADNLLDRIEARRFLWAILSKYTGADRQEFWRGINWLCETVELNL